MNYRFTGLLDEIYATLVVRLHHTEPFQQDQFWRYATDFTTNTGKRLGVKLTRRGTSTLPRKNSKNTKEIRLLCDLRALWRLVSFRRMEVRDWLRRESDDENVSQLPSSVLRPPSPTLVGEWHKIVFAGERFDVMSVRRWRERVLG